MRTDIFDRLAFLSLFLVIILLPVFFLPFTNISIDTSKGLLLVLGLVACIIFWAIARFLDGRLIFPRSALLVSGFAISLVFLLSSLFSTNPHVSLFGTMFDVGSFWFILSGFLLMAMSAIILRDTNKAKAVLLGAILSGAVVLIFQIARLFVPDFLSFGVLFAKTDNLLGTWNTLGIFAGFLALMSLLVVEFFSITKKKKLALQILTILSMVMVAAVNFAFVWKLLGIFALIIFVYKVSIASKEKAEDHNNIHVEESDTPDPSFKKTHFPVFSFIIIMITLLFFMSGNVIGGFLPDRLGLVNNEVSPSLSSTLAITKSVLKENPVLGMGPNRFTAAWAQYKPESINQTLFWDVSFNSGSGLLPTLAATTGALGILTLLIFLALFLVNGIRSVFSSIKQGVNWEIVAFFVLALYLFVSSFFYSTGAVLFLLSLAFTGGFVGLTATGRDRGEVSFMFLNDHRKSFFSILFILLLIIISAAISFKYVERFASVAYFGKALSVQTVEESEVAITKALRLHVNDLYLRTYSQVYLVKLDSLLQRAESLTEAEKTQLQVSLDQAVNGAELATVYNSQNYLNFQALGSLYQSLTAFGVEDVGGKAIEAYQKASALNPNNPGIKLAIARAFFADGKMSEAKDYAGQALSLKSNYIDALITLSQIAQNEGNNAEAISRAQAALSFAPSDASLIHYLDSLRKPSNTPPSTSDTTSGNGE